jgi:hypothetical protein
MHKTNMTREEATHKQPIGIRAGQLVISESPCGLCRAFTRKHPRPRRGTFLDGIMSVVKCPALAWSRLLGVALRVHGEKILFIIHQGRPPAAPDLCWASRDATTQTLQQVASDGTGGDGQPHPHVLQSSILPLALLH